MNVLFLTLVDFSSFMEKNIYCDLLREFINRNDYVYCISPTERRKKECTHFSEGNKLLKLKIGNIQKTNFIEKGITTLQIEKSFIRAIKKYFSNIKFDLILYSTPPITFSGVVKYIKKRDNAKAYLMLKDIFPQNSLDLGMLSKTGIKGLIYKYFRKKEIQLYKLADVIGCMSQANINYIVKNNPGIDKCKVDLCPNCIQPIDISITDEEKQRLRVKYAIPQNKIVFVYGGNLGRPQDVPFIIKCLKECANLDDLFFCIAGDGTDRHFLDEYIKTEKPNHVRLYDQLPKEEYDNMVACCDVGLIFLDHRFTIPNFPSRLLSYMQARLPVLACTDPNTDIRQVILDGGFGWWCESDRSENFYEVVKNIKKENINVKGQNAWAFLIRNYDVSIIYKSIIEQIKNIDTKRI